MPCSHKLAPLSGQFATFPEIPCWCELTEAEDGILFRIDNEVYTFVALPIKCINPDCTLQLGDVESWMQHIMAHLTPQQNRLLTSLMDEFGL